MPWMAVEKKYEFEGPKGKGTLLDLFEGRRQLIVYRAFFEPGVFGWPDHACRGCSLGADQVSHLAHLNARDTTLAWASRAPQSDIARSKSADGLGDALVHHYRQLRQGLQRRLNGTATMFSSATASGCSAHISSTAAATKRWERSGAISTSPRSAVRRPGRTRRRVIPKRHPISGGTGTTTTMPSQRLTRSGSTS
jgi:hypothetical protein